MGAVRRPHPGRTLPFFLRADPVLLGFGPGGAPYFTVNYGVRRRENLRCGGATLRRSCAVLEHRRVSGETAILDRRREPTNPFRVNPRRAAKTRRAGSRPNRTGFAITARRRRGLFS